MTPVQFVDWLQGYIESGEPLDMDLIVRRLSEVVHPAEPPGGVVRPYETSGGVEWQDEWSRPSGEGKHTLGA